MGIFAVADGKNPNKSNLSRGKKKTKHFPRRAGVREEESTAYLKPFPIQQYFEELKYFQKG